ncbi:MAG: ADP-glyceromanno-heptose 6-epimerase [Salibacteraceae bacterium]
MIIVTGAAGFIGSCLAKDLSDQYAGEVVIVDDFHRKEKLCNLRSIERLKQIDRDEFFRWLENQNTPEAIIHIGARTDTTEFDYSIFEKLNVDFTKKVWSYCANNDVALIYASSAATYGGGEHGYSDDHALVDKLKPLNPYGESKQAFDLWALSQVNKPKYWYGLKFFNVYGPNEYHKGRMASVVFHAYNQIESTGKMHLFRSHNKRYKDGEQLRDFIYVKDVISVIQFLLKTKPESGLYNLGTGNARTFIDLVKSVFSAMDKEMDIAFIDTPEDIRDKYQYFTEADMRKLRKAGYQKALTSLEAGVNDYVTNYLLRDANY